MYRKLDSCFPCRVEGWLMVCDKEVKPGHYPSPFCPNGNEEMSSVVWEPYFCVLLQNGRIFNNYRSEEMSIFPGFICPSSKPTPNNHKISSSTLFLDLPRVRLDGGRQAFRKKWGYDATPAPPLLEEDEDLDLSETHSLRDETLLSYSSLDTSYEKACGERRGSAPATPVVTVRNVEPSTTPGKFVNFFSKRSFKNNPLKRTKSVTKLERKRCTMETDGLKPARLRASRSHESLLQTSQNMLHTLDLSRGEIQIKALHSSILGQDHCFQVSSPSGTRYYSCRTAEERDRWIQSLRRSTQSDHENANLTDNSLKIWILEVKGIPVKKRYFCELCLDKNLYARTMTKLKREMCFWGEHFDFNNLPNIQTIKVSLYRECDRKKKKEKNTLIGVVNIPVPSVNSRHLIEKWYPVVMEKNTNQKETPSIRIKCKYQTVDILPMSAYRECLTYLKNNYLILCDMLEPVISVKAKEDLGGILINIMQRELIAQDFLADIVMADIERIDDEHLAFRGNTLATKAMEAYMKLVGHKYLQETLGDLIKVVMQSTDDCEVDPLKVTNSNQLLHQQNKLISYVETAWIKILNSYCYFPIELRQVFHKYRQRLIAIGKEDLSDNLISASIFLRFLCPAILSPSLFNLTQEYPQERQARTLTLIAKTIQTLANFTLFGGKENFMDFMNHFVEREWTPMKTFLKQISSPISSDQHQQNQEFDGFIDLGKEMSILRTILIEILPKITSKSYQNEVERLQQILSEMTPNGSPSRTPAVMSLVANETNQAITRPVTAVSSPNNINNNNQLLVNRQISQPHDNRVITVPESPKASTLPRTSNTALSNYTVGSSKRPADDLSTADDYVLFSALHNSNNVNNNNKRTSSRSFDDSRRRLVTTTIGTSNGQGTAILNGNPEYLDLLSFVDEDSTRAVDGDVKGSQTSIGQISNVASSGYQSFAAYSQSNSPVDPAIHQQDSSLTASLTSSGSSSLRAHHQPLAFANPMYHFPSTPKQTSHVDFISPEVNRSPTSSTGSENSSEVARVTSGLISSSSTRHGMPPVERRQLSNSSSDSTPAMSTPPSVPRTNPHLYKSAVSASASVISQVSTHNYHNHHHHYQKLYNNDSRKYKDLRQVPGDGDGEKPRAMSTPACPWDSMDSRSTGYPLSPTVQGSWPNRENKTVEEYEREIEDLRRVMLDLQIKLNDAEQKLQRQDSQASSTSSSTSVSTTSHHPPPPVEWPPEEKARWQTQDKDEQMRNIISRLISVEDKLRREQDLMAEDIRAKERIIEDQERRILSLDIANGHLKSALTQLSQKNSRN